MLGILERRHLAAQVDHSFAHVHQNLQVSGRGVFPQLQGDVFFADYCSGAIWSLRVQDGTKDDFKSRTAQLSPSIDGFNVASITSFGEDADGELYIVTSGAVFKIVPRP